MPPVYPRLNFPINISPSSRSTANSSLESEAKSVPRLRGRRSRQQGLGSSPAAQHSDLDGINYQLDDMATRDQDPLHSSAESSTHLRAKIQDVFNSTARINTPTRDAAFQRAEDARIAAAWKNGREAKPADKEPLISSPFTTPSKQGQTTTSGKRQQQQPDIFDDPNIMASFDTAAIVHSDKELERMRNDIALAKAEQAEAEQQQKLQAAATSNVSTEKPRTPVPNSQARQQTPDPSGGAFQNTQTTIPNGIKKEQQMPLSNGSKHEQYTTPIVNGTKRVQQQTPISNGTPNLMTPASVDTPKNIANTAAVVEASAKIKQLAEDLEAAGWEMQTVKQDVSEVRSELGGVKREMSGIKEEVGLAKKDLKAVNAEVAGLKGEVVCLREFLETVSGQVGMLARNLESTSGQMTGLEKSVQGMKQDMEGLKGQGKFSHSESLSSSPSTLFPFSSSFLPGGLSLPFLE
ncbi:MAG: hypothetical protein OHK93_004447 [Ramalina farinacea]|uniref:Uncharacterized protein n=1 Tax=Ramalina farinacea TaxID=258253 RepID=A0AA43QYK4_9LECA|nr:hypothetical protein [Ramalina farinacea]